MNATSQHTLIAVFRDRTAAEAAVDDLHANGFVSSDIYGAGTSATSTKGTATNHEGGIVGWFKSIFDGEDTADHTVYESAVQRGNIAVRVQANAYDTERAVKILNDHSPVNVEDRDVEDRDATTSEYPAGATGANTVQAGANEAIPVIQEELRVGKRVVQRGGVRVYARTIEEPVSEDVRLREETVRVERTPVNREATSADLQPGREQVFEVQEFREEPVVSKTARVVEEVRIGKESSERVDTVRDTVRRTEVNVENLGSSEAGAGRYEAGFEGAQAGTVGSYNDDPAYQYGVTASSDPRYAGRSYDDVENDLRSDYSTRYPGSTWEQAKASVRRGWEKLSAKAHNA